jgi:heat shock protein HslJ
MEKINDRGIKPRENAREIFIVFDDANHVVTGRAGCNAFRAAYCRRDGGRVSFSILHATKMACPDMYVDAMFFKILEETNGYSIRRGRLRLKRDDETIAVFRLARTR